MADAHEAFGQHVEEESAQELHCVQGHDALLAAVSMEGTGEIELAFSADLPSSRGGHTASKEVPREEPRTDHTGTRFPMRFHARDRRPP
jgi:hypothetical protein